MLTDDVPRDSRYAKRSRNTISQVLLPEHTFRYLVADYQRDGGS